MIGTDRGRESEKSMLSVWTDDDDDDCSSTTMVFDLDKPRRLILLINKEAEAKIRKSNF